MSVFISRLAPGSSAFNTINERKVDVFFQKSPQFPGPKSGTKDLEFQVVDQAGNVVQSGKTGDDGKITVRIRGGSATLQLMFGGAPVAEYTIKINDDNWEAKDTVLGVQRRLRTLGFQLGHTGANGDGIDGAINAATDRAMEDFQIDNDLLMDGIFNGASQDKLNTATGGTAGSN